MENYEMLKGTKDYNVKFGEFPHYKKHPQMMPFVGKNWGKHKKLLVIGESHYLANGFNIETIKNWYNISLDDLNDKDKDIAYWWTNTARLIDTTDYHIGTMWKQIRDAILKADFNPTDDVFSYISYMNFFQRPALEEGGSVKKGLTSEDISIANKTIKSVIDAIKPDYLFFVSSFSWDNFDKSLFDKKYIGHSCLPLGIWWNRKSAKYANLTGKGSFIEFIKRNNIFNR
jgi:hypothetical protein